MIRDKLEKLGACNLAIYYLGESTYKEAWAKCTTINCESWLIWLLMRMRGKPDWLSSREVAHIIFELLRASLYDSNIPNKYSVAIETMINRIENTWPRKKSGRFLTRPNRIVNNNVILMIERCLRSYCYSEVDILTERFFMAVYYICISFRYRCGPSKAAADVFYAFHKMPYNEGLCNKINELLSKPIGHL